MVWARVGDGVMWATVGGLLSPSPPLQGALPSPSPPIPLQGAFSVLAGAEGSAGHVDGPLAEARFDRPHGVCASPAGDAVFVADMNNSVVRKINLTAGEWGGEGKRLGERRGRGGGRKREGESLGDWMWVREE